jgi:hypothetical protein
MKFLLPGDPTVRNTVATDYANSKDVQNAHKVRQGFASAMVAGEGARTQTVIKERETNSSVLLMAVENAARCPVVTNLPLEAHTCARATAVAVDVWLTDVINLPNRRPCSV